MNRKLKKCLSVILSLVMILTAVDSLVFSSIASLSKTDNPSASVEFIVPEGAYLTPSTVGSGDYLWCEYYLNNCNGSGAYSYASGAEGSARLYFYCAEATSVSISASFSAGGWCSDLTTSASGTTLFDNSFTIAATNQNSIITWTATFTCKDGITRTATSYTYIYKPYNSPVGVASDMASGKDAWVGQISMLWGINGHDNGSHGCNSSMYMSNRPNLWVGANQNPESASFVNGGWYPHSFNYYKGGSTTVSSPWGHYYVDGSRYGNINQIPDIRFGLTMSDDECTARTVVYVDFQYSNGSGIQNFTNGWQVSSETCFWNWWSNVRPSFAMSNIGANSTQYFRIHTYMYGSGNSGCGNVYSHSDVYFWVHNSYKQYLRDTYITQIRQSYNRQAVKYTSASWQNYMNALSTAASVLGNPCVNYDSVASAQTALNNAANALTLQSYTANNRFVALNHNGTGYIVGNLKATTTTEALNFNSSNTVNSSANTFTGYTFLGYKANYDDTIGTKTYTSDFDGITRTNSWSKYWCTSNAYVTYYYIPNTYTITLNPQSATSDGTATVYESYGDGYYSSVDCTSKITSITKPEKTGYVFGGYYTSQNGEGTQIIDSSGNFIGANVSTQFTQNQELYAKWTPINYYFTFNGNNSTSGSIEKQSFVYDAASKALTANNFERTGYTYTGWNTEANGTGTALTDEQSLQNFTTVSEKNITLYAQWQAHEYTVKYDLDGGDTEGFDDYDATYDVSFTIPTAKKTGYSFVKWTASNGEEYTQGQTVSNLTSVDGDTVTLTAVWSINDYTIAFDTGDADPIDSIVQNYDTDYVMPENPTLTGFAFVKWDWYNSDEGTAITKPEKIPAFNVKAVADWKPSEYTIKYALNGGTGEGFEDVEAKYGTSYTIPQISKKGYTFVNWTDNLGNEYAQGATLKNLTAVDGDEITITANFTINQYSITYDVQGADEEISQLVEDYDTPYTDIPTPVKTGYTFTGWNWFNEDDEAIEEPTAIPDYNIKAVATWSVNHYTVNFVLNGGTGEGFESFTATYDETYTLNDITKEGFTFVNWTDDNSVGYGQRASFKNLSAVDGATVTLTANFSINQYAITYDVQGADEEISQLVEDYDTPYTDIPTPVKTGYTFTGWNWFKAENDEAIEEPSKIPAYNITAVATWSVNHYTVVLDTDGGTAENDIEATYDEPFTLPIVTKLGYTFSHWSFDTQSFAEEAEVSNLSAIDDSSVTLTAVWNINSYSIEFDTDGADEDVSTITQNYNTVYEPPVPVKTGYTFTGWTYVNKDTSESVTEPSNIPAYDMLATATWSVNHYTVEYNVDGGVECDDTEATYDVEFNLPFTKKVGFNFVKWTYGSNEYGAEATVSNLSPVDGATVTLVAVWKPCQHSYTEYTTVDYHHSRTCTVCEYVDEADCSGFTYDALENDKHYKTCGVCQFVTTVDCTDATHDCVCDYCGDTMAHPFGDWISNNDKTHTRICQNCTTQETVDCVDLNHNCVCDDCGYEIPHIYGDWFNHNNGTHSMICQVCGNKDTFPCVADPNNSCICATCGYQVPHTYEAWTSNDNSTQTKTCSVCQYEITSSCVDKNHDCVCDECNYSFEHIWTMWASNNDGTHSRECKNCSTKETKSCNLSTPVAMNVGQHTSYCSDCMYVLTENCERNANCKCNKCGQDLPHVLTNTTKNSDMTHTYSCDVCSKSVSEDCYDMNRDCVCDVCGNEFEHIFEKYTFNNNASCTEDGTETAYCKNCKVATDTRTKANSKTSHRFTVYTYNNDATCTTNGTMTAYCDYCSIETDTKVATGTLSGHSYQGSVSGNAVTYKCLFCESGYTYTFDLDGGTIVSLHVGMLPTLKKSGYTFAGFEDKDGAEVKSYPVAQTGITIYAKWTEKTDWIEEKTPNAGIDYSSMRITGLSPKEKYLVNGVEIVADSLGRIALSNDDFGKSLTVVKVGDGEYTCNSAEQSLELSQLSEAPIEELFTVVNPVSLTERYSIVSGLNSDMEYSTNGGATWFTPKGTSVKVESGTTVSIRYKATKTAPASLVTTVVTEAPVNECTCKCHQSGFLGSLYRLYYGVMELFGKKHVCCDSPLYYD